MHLRRPRSFFFSEQKCDLEYGIVVAVAAAAAIPVVVAVAISVVVVVVVAHVSGNLSYCTL